MRKETTLLDRLILREMTGKKISKGKRLIREAGEDPMGGAGQDPMAGADEDPMAGGADAGQDPMGGAGADPMAGGAGAGQDPMGGAGQDPMAGAGADPMAGLDSMGGEDEEDDAETLNIDDLTNSQEKMNNKINTIGQNQIKTDSRIENLLHAVEKLKATIDDNNEEIQRLQQDIIKRNPTPTEDLYLQSLASYPYNTNIADYWKDKIKTGRDNYNIIAGGMTSTKADKGQDIDGDNEGENIYEITTDDLDDLSAEDVYKSFSINDDEDEHDAFRPRF